MLVSCRYCGRIHERSFDCGKRPARRGKRKEQEKIRQKARVKKKMEQVKKDAGYLCEYCLSQGRLTYTDLQTHHIIKLTQRPDLAVEDTNLVVLCHSCHEKAEKGEISPQFLSELAQKRAGHIPPAI